jgi:AcrR family transcriptional regulator
LVGTEAGGRRDRTHTAVMRATAELMREVGVKATTAEAIAARAGVSKATLYKWWPNKTAIAIEAFAQHMSQEISIPDTGSGRDDLVQQLREVITFLAGPDGQLLVDLVADAQATPGAIADLNERFFEPRMAAVGAFWARGVERGDFRADILPEIAMDLIYGPIVARLLTGRFQPSLPHVPEYVDWLLSGLENQEKA